MSRTLWLTPLQGDSFPLDGNQLPAWHDATFGMISVASKNNPQASKA
jgi:hypothetical protein